MKRMKYFLGLLFVASSMTVSAQTDFFGIPKITLGNEEYSLAWSAKIKFRYVEDFLPKKSSNSHFTTKISIDYYDADVDVERVSASKMAELEINQAENLLTKLTKSTASNGDELIEYVAFVPAGEKMKVAEWNLCRFSANSRGVVLFQMKHRDYDVKLDKFLSKVEKKKAGWINDVTTYQIPEIKVSEPQE